MQNDIKSKSTDFLPGKPANVNADVLDISGKSAKQRSAQAAGSAHVIDLKSTKNTFSDAPLLQDDPTSPAPVAAPAPPDKVEQKVEIKPVTQVKPQPQNEEEMINELIDSDDKIQEATKSDQPAKSQASQDTKEASIAAPQADQNITESAQTDTTKPVKKSSKLKWVFIILGILIAGAAIGGGVIYLLTQSTL